MLNSANYKHVESYNLHEEKQELKRSNNGRKWTNLQPTGLFQKIFKIDYVINSSDKHVTRRVVRKEYNAKVLASL
jgi:hypothetical protein